MNFEAGGFNFEMGKTRMVHTYTSNYEELGKAHILAITKKRVKRIIEKLLSGKTVEIALRCRGRRDENPCDVVESWTAVPRELKGGKVYAVRIGCQSVSRGRLLKLLQWAKS